MNSNGNNRFDESIHHVPLGELPRSRYADQHLNEIIWLRPLERQQRQRREASYKRQLMEIDQNYRQVLATQIWAMQRRKKEAWGAREKSQREDGGITLWHVCTSTNSLYSKCNSRVYVNIYICIRYMAIDACVCVYKTCSSSSAVTFAFCFSFC